MPRKKINRLMEAWAASIHQATSGKSMDGPFVNYEDMFKTIDKTPLGDVRWRCFTVTYNSVMPEGDIPPWMSQPHEVWFRCPREVLCNILANPEFKTGFDTTPYREYTSDGKRVFSDIFSANWVWRQAVGLLLSSMYSY